MKRGVPARPGTKPLPRGEVDINQLKQLIEIQTQVVKQAKQNELAQKNRKAGQWKLAGRPRAFRRFVGFISQLW